MDRDPWSPHLSGSSEKDLQFTRTMNISQKNAKRAKRIGEALENCPVLTKATLVRSRCFSNGIKPVPPNAQPRSDNSPSSVARPRLAGVPSRRLMAASRVEYSPNQGVTSDVSEVGQQLIYSNGPAEPEEDRQIVVSPPAARPPGRVPRRVSRIPTCEAQGRTFPELLRASQMCSTTCRCVFSGIKPVPPISRGTKPLPDRDQGMPRDSGKAGQTGRPLERPTENNLQVYGEEEAVDYEERPNSLRFLQYTVAEEQDLLSSPPHNFLDGIKAGSDNSPPLAARPRLAGIPSRKLMAASRVEDSPNQGPGEPEEDRLIVVSPPAATPPARVPRRLSRIPRRVLGSSTRVASHQSLMSCPGQGISTGNTSVEPLARVYGQAVQQNSYPQVQETHKMGHVQDRWRSVGSLKKRLRMIGGDGSAEERDNISFPPLKSTPHIADELSPALKGKRRDGPEQPGLQSFSRPELALTQSLQFLASDDWERKVDGLSFIRRLSQHHPVILISRLHDVSLALVQEVKNLRSAVSRMAVVCLGDVFTFLKRRMDPELGNTVKVLLEKAGESNTFIRQSVDSTLDCMVQSCTPARAVNALLNGGLSHLNSRVRACMAHHLADLVERMGAHNLPRDITNRILPAATRLAQDASQETRHFGQRLLSSLKDRL